jgi:hypothetical protein
MGRAWPVSRSAERPHGLGTRLITAAGWLACAVALARVAMITLGGLPIPSRGVANGSDVERMQDFRDATYYPIRELWRSGGMPYDPDVMFAHWPVIQEFDLYLPAHLWLHAPLALPGYRTAAALMLLLDGALLLLLARWAVQWAPGLPRSVRTWAWPWLGAAVMVGQVGKAQLYLGQVNPLVAVGTAGALGWRRRPSLAAVCLALAWLKPQYGLPLTLLLLAGGHRRVALAGTGLAGIASLPVVAVLIARTGGVGGFVEVVQRNLAYATSTGYGAVGSPDGHRIDLTASLARALAWTPPAVAEAVTAAVIIGGAALLVRRAGRTGTGSDAVPSLRRALIDLVTVVAVLLAVVHQPGDVLAAVPAGFAVAVAASVTLHRRRVAICLPAAAAAAAVALAVPHLHLYAVDRVLTSGVGRTAAGLLDAVAVTAAGLLATIALTILVRNDGRARSDAVA